MRLSARDRPEALRRFQHLRAAGPGRARCGTAMPGATHVCTRKRGHRGPHAAHRWFGRVVAVWTHPGGVAPPRVRRSAGRPVGLRESPAGRVGELGRWLLRLLVDVEQVALFLMFVAFVYFAIDWLKLIFR